VREAAGDADRFNQVYAQYKLAPAVTRERLYIETMQRVLEKSNKVIIDNKGASAPVILPPDAFRPKEFPTRRRPPRGSRPDEPLNRSRRRHRRSARCSC
jgi:hypothetical protein